MRFQGKTIIVAGGAHGIGRACTRAFAAEGGAVVIADLDVEAGQALAAEIGGRGGKALSVRADVGDAREAGCLVDAALEWACGVDVLVSGLDPAGAPDLADCVPIGEAAALAMAARGRGAIVILAPADATGSGVLVERVGALARALADRNIRVNLVGPLPADGDPAKLVDLVLFAASDAAGTLTGRCFDAADAPLAVARVDA